MLMIFLYVLENLKRLNVLCSVLAGTEPVLFYVNRAPLSPSKYRFTGTPYG